MTSSLKVIKVGARESRLSKVQVKEVLLALQKSYPEVQFVPCFFKTTGDKDQKTSLLHQEKTDFFTKEIDEALLKGLCRIGIHSAKDLPSPIPLGLSIVACTEGVDSSDVLVFREGESFASLPNFAKIGTSSLRRVENVKALNPSFRLVDIRGTIDQRLLLLDEGKVDALVMAKAALIRLEIVRETFHLPGMTSPMQGRLSVLAREEDVEMRELFSCLHRPF